MTIDSEVTQANKKFYDAVAKDYEAIDGRRSIEVLCWLTNKISKVSKCTQRNTILDIGCGAGFVLKCSDGIFKKKYGIDISRNILQDINLTDGIVVCGDSYSLPFKDNSMDVVVAFAALHHFYNITPVLSEVFRVLKSGGIFYSDHDMDKNFVKRFGVLLKLYRAVFNMGDKYVNVSKKITKKLYSLSEIHSDGIESDKALLDLRGMGFKDISVCYHWFGLSFLFNKLFGQKSFKRGNAPLISIIARK